MKTRILGALLIWVLALTLATPAARAAACSVPGTYATIQAAVDDTRCSTVAIGVGTFPENVMISRSVTLDGSGAQRTVVNGGGARSAFTILGAGTVVILSDMTITGGSDLSGGGIGIGNNANVAVISVAVHANHAVVHGGGIFVGTAAILQLISSTVDANDVANSGSGGGIDNFGGTVQVVNSTISGNFATGSGGGIANEGGGGGLVRLWNATIAFNEADADLNGSGSGGGIYNPSPNTTTMLDSIVANNLESDFDPESNRYFRLPGDCSGALGSNGYNILATNNCGVLPSTGDKFNVDPKLGPLADNGGSTRTHALLEHSPAIDAGRPAGCIDHNGSIMTNDQRFWARPYPAGGICDSGAYERGAFEWLPVIAH